VSGIFKKDGFSLIEIVVAIALMVLVATVVVPRLIRPKKVIKEFAAQVNTLLARVYTSTLITTQVHKVIWDLEKSLISTEKATGEKTSAGEEIFVPLEKTYSKASIEIPESIEIRNFFIQGIDELVGAPTKKVWFFVVPQGVAQNVIINLLDEDNDQLFSLVLNPFTVQMRLYDEFKKPE
jgi:prepilin-type N-terminal cleavage/methylation domain-containing protein